MQDGFQGASCTHFNHGPLHRNEIVADCVIYRYIFCLFQVLQEEVGLLKLVDIFCTEGYNKYAKLNYLAPLLSNLTQLPEARSLIVDKDKCVAGIFSSLFL